MRLLSAIYQEFHPFDYLDCFTDFAVSSKAEDIRKGDVLVVWGGEDISTSLYNHVNLGDTHAPKLPSRRDTVEWTMMQRAKELKVPIIGVCRGAQMLCALAGGYLIQDVDNHGGMHEIETTSGISYWVNSLHHQMLYPFDVKHELLAWTPTRSPRHITTRNGYQENLQIDKEPELVYFPEVLGFAIQWHPEMMRAEAPATEYLFGVFNEKFLVMESV